MHTFKTNAGIVLWSFLNAILGSYISFVIFARLDRGEHNSKRMLIISLSAFLLVIGCWSANLLGTRVNLHFGDSHSIFLPLSSGFVVLSFLLPYMITFGALVVTDLGSGSNPWKCILCALVIGLSVDFMHYALYLFFQTIFASFSTPHIFISLFLCLSATLFSYLCLTILKTRFLSCVRMRIFLPMIFGSAIVGASTISITGTSFTPKSNFTHQTNFERNYRDSITLILPAIITFILISSIIFLHACSITEEFRKHAVVPRLTIASVAFSTDGRILVNEKGMLPLRIVDLHGLPKNILEEFDTEHDTFHWLMSISFHWDILMPMLGKLEYKTFSERRLTRRILPSFVRLLSNQMSPEHAQSGLKSRMLTAIAQLADDLGISISELGYLYDRTLETGTHVDLTEFLLLSENASTEYRDVRQKALKRTAAASNSGLMLFFVRDLPRHQSSNSSSTASNDGSVETSWPQKYAEKGYRLKFMRRFRDTLAEATGAAQRDVDRILLGCRDYVSNGTKSVLEPDGTYISLYSERTTISGGKEVLVYDFAKHQTPSYRLDIEELSSDMRTWLLNASGITASELIDMCKRDISRVREEVRFSAVSQHVDYLQEKELVVFKEALAYALEQLLQEMSFLGPDLAQSTRLTNEVCVVPSLGGEPATSIIFDVDLPGVSLDRDESAGRGISSCSSECEENMPSLFTYSPKRLFDVSQALIRTTMEDFKERTATDLDQLLSTRSSRNTFHPESKSRFPHSNSVALVSSFSLDTISLAPSTNSSPSRRIASKVASCWTTLRNGSRSLPTKLIGKRHVSSPSASTVAGISVLSGSRSLVDFRKSNSSQGHGLPPVPSLPPRAALLDFTKLQRSPSSRHPYLHLSLPSPLILAKHHSERRGSDATVQSSDAEQYC